MPPRRITRPQVIEALEILLEALREGSGPEALPLVRPDEARAGRPCPVHLRELVRGRYRGRELYLCPVEGCRAGDIAA